MTDSKHTPGPWSLEGNCVYSLNAKGVNHFWVRVDRGSSCSMAEVDANAHLITAAPDMLDALEAVHADDTARLPGPVWEKVRAAIKKARGDLTEPRE